VEDLDMQGFADNNPLFSVGEYFNLLYIFSYLAPKASGALARIVHHKSAANSVQSLTEVRILLKNMGCDKYVLPFSEIVEAIKNNNMTYAVCATERIIDDFNGFCTQIMTAKKAEKMEILPNSTNVSVKAHENYATAYRNQSLKKVLEELDHEEAARKLRILVVDDSPVMIKTISSVLEGDYNVQGIVDPLLVEEFLEKMIPELFILDYKMPKLNGFELVPKIRKFADHAKTPIIFLTSMGTADNISTALSLGACDFIVKPFQPEILREKVAKHIVRKKSR